MKTNSVEVFNLLRVCSPTLVRLQVLSFFLLRQASSLSIYTFSMYLSLLSSSILLAVYISLETDSDAVMDTRNVSILRVILENTRHIFSCDFY